KITQTDSLLYELLMTHFAYKEFYGRNLPHFQPPLATLFITFRLAGSIPQAGLEEWLQEKRRLQATQRDEAEGPTAFQRRWFARFESLLDAGTTGPLWLKEPEVAEIVRQALLHRDGRGYRLDAFSIMPNHVHAVFAPLLSETAARELAERSLAVRREANWGSVRRGSEASRDVGCDAQTDSLRDPETQTDSLLYPGTQTDSLLYSGSDPAVLSTIMQSLKGFTARKCNLALGRSGAFWQHESFDRVIRDGDEFDRVLRYVLNNPVNAGLSGEWREWTWNYCRPDLIERHGL